MINLENALRDKRILIVDDLVEARSSLKKMLILLGAPQPDTATDGRDAIERIMEHDYDIVLSDYNLGKGKDGQQILEEARYARRLRASALFILVTGENALEMVMGALEYEPDNYITKPFTLNMLRERLIRIMTLKEQLASVDEAIDQHDNALAISRAESLLKENPRLRVPLARTLGRLYIRAQRYQEALAVYSSLLNSRSISWARLGQAICIHHLGDSQSALALINQTLLSHPLYVQCYDWSARILCSLGRNDEAQKQLQKAVAISPKAVLRQMELGRIAYENGDFPVAENAFQQAVRLGRHSCYKSSENYLFYARSARHQLRPNNSREQKTRADKILKAVDELRQDYAGQHTIMFETSIVASQTFLSLNKTDLARAAANQAEEALALIPSPPAACGLQMTATFLDTNQHVKAKNMIKQLRASGLDDSSAEKLQNLEDNLNRVTIREYTAELNERGVRHYEQSEYAQAAKVFDEAASYEEAGISVLLNAIQAKISLMEHTQVDVSYLKDCYRYFRRIGPMGDQDERYERYARLRHSFSRLKRAAGF